MERKKTKIISVLILFVFVFSLLLFSGGKIYAGCCINGNACSTTSDPSACLNATYSTSNCSTIASCDPAASGSTATSYTTTGNVSTAFANPIAFTTVSQLLSAILNNLMGIIVFISVIFIIIGGVMYMMSAGNEQMVTRAKKTWTGAVIGLAIALAAPTFLKEIQNILGGASGTGGSADQWVSGALTIRQIAINILNLLLSVIGIVAIIAMVIGGGTYLTAYGDERKIETGKKIITYAIIGIIVSLASLIIVRQVDNLLRGTATNGNASNSADYQPGPYTTSDNSADYQPGPNINPNSGYIPNESNTPNSYSDNNVVNTDQMTQEEFQQMSPN